MFHRNVANFREDSFAVSEPEKQNEPVMFKIIFSKQAIKDAQNVREQGLEYKVKRLLEILRENPFKTPPSYKKLVGDCIGAYSRRINRRSRLGYKVDKEEKKVTIIRMWTHYKD